MAEKKAAKKSAEKAAPETGVVDEAHEQHAPHGEEPAVAADVEIVPADTEGVDIEELPGGGVRETPRPSRRYSR